MVAAWSRSACLRFGDGARNGGACPHHRWTWEGFALPNPPRREEEWGNPVSPCPNRRWERLAPPQAGVRFDRLTAGGETRFPHVPTAVGSGWRPHRQGDGETRFSHVPTAVGSGWHPQGRGMGKPGFPVCSHQPSMRLRRIKPEGKYYCSWEGCALPNPPRWRVVSREGCALPNPPRWRVVSREGCALPNPPRWRAIFTSVASPSQSHRNGPA